MKNLLLLLAIVLLASCGAEKRLYRPGWYSDRHHAKNSLQQEKEAAAIPQQISVSTDSVTIADTTIAVAEKPAANATTATPASSLPASIHAASPPAARPDPPMSYAEARRRMTEQGCTPNAFATAIYIMGFASLILDCVGAGLLFSLLTLVLSIFATNSVIAKGQCIDENLALVSLGRRLAILGLIIMAVMTVVLFIAVIAFFLATNAR